MKFRGSQDGKLYNLKFDIEKFEYKDRDQNRVVHDLIMIIQTPKPSFVTAIYETQYGETNMAKVLAEKHYIYEDDGKTRINPLELHNIFEKTKKELLIVQYELF